MKLVFATNNPHKVQEIGALLGESFQLHGLKEVGINDHLPEDQDTLEGNASQKAWYVYQKLKTGCFADDTGLEVDGLNGPPVSIRPGIQGSGILFFRKWKYPQGISGSCCCRWKGCRTGRPGSER